MFPTTSRVALAAALTTAIGLGAGAASASAATTISGLPDRAPIVNKLYVPVPITVSCDPTPGPPTPPPPFPPFPPFSSASVTIRQVISHRLIAHGSGSIGGLTCDSAPHTYTVNVFPDTGGFPGGSDSPPFRRGVAVLNAQVSTGFGFTTTAGPQPIRLIR